MGGDSGPFGDFGKMLSESWNDNFRETGESIGKEVQRGIDSAFRSKKIAQRKAREKAEREKESLRARQEEQKQRLSKNERNRLMALRAASNLRTGSVLTNLQNMSKSILGG